MHYVEAHVIYYFKSTALTLQLQALIMDYCHVEIFQDSFMLLFTANYNSSTAVMVTIGDSNVHTK